MKIGIYFNAKKSNGGLYQYALTILDIITSLKEHSYVVFNMSDDFPDEYRGKFRTIDLNNKDGFYPHIDIKTRFKALIFDRFIRLKQYEIASFILKSIFNIWLKQIMKEAPEIMFYTSPHYLAFIYPAKSLVPVHDLQHRLQPHFPEVSADGEWEYREYLYSQIAKKASKILVDSLVGKEDILNCYPDTNPEKVFILPFVPPPYFKRLFSNSNNESFLMKEKLPSEYLFYPAQFWPHKNHMNLLKAIRILKDEGKIIHLVLTGTKQEKWGTFDKVQSFIQENGLHDQVHYLGYVSNEEMYTIYTHAKALIMPTFFGPTNIPVIEAWELGLPVLYSRLRGWEYLVGDAALLFDPDQPWDIAKKIDEFLMDKQLQIQLIARGRQRVENWNMERLSEQIIDVIDSLK